jgi:hypothetical protein
MEGNSTIAARRLPGGINSAAHKKVSAMILSYHDSVPPTFADKGVNANGHVPSRGKQNVFEPAVKAGRKNFVGFRVRRLSIK